MLYASQSKEKGIAVEKLSFFNLASQRLGWLTESQRVVSENVANADTPGFKARKVSSFQEMLSSTQQSHLQTTNTQHIRGFGSQAGVKVHVDEETWSESLNGNTVVLEQQSIRANEIAENYQLAANLYRKGHDLIRLAVTGVR